MFDDVVRRATEPDGHGPYDYQRELAERGLPEVLSVPTGAGKTLAAVLPWLYRRRWHPDAAVRGETPRWLVLTLPMRVLVEQTVEEVERWLHNLGLESEVRLYRVMGGEGRADAAWRMNPDGDAIFVGTQDMLLSRALNRGYGESRWAWPMDFGLLSSGAQWVFDEVQLMGPALETSRQLEAFRRSFGGALPSRSMWMSATVDRGRLSTVDNPEVDRVLELSERDRIGPLRVRLEAEKTVRQLHVASKTKDYLRDLATTVREKHREGTRTIVVLNTVDRATDLYRLLRKDDALGKDDAPDVVLVHSRFRPLDRKDAVDKALAEVDSSGPGRVVVSTQVLEAGVDISSGTLVTELAPWSSVVQRCGRCNRDGLSPGATVWWVEPPGPAPYDEEALERARAALTDLEGVSAAPSVLQTVEVKAEDVIHPVLRRADLLDLFDTLPDLSGNDVDVSRFIRALDDTDVQVAWWDLKHQSDRVEAPDRKAPLPGRDERCAVPISAVKAKAAWFDERHVFRYDHIDEQWVRCWARDVRPGQVLVMDSADGGYDPEVGWSPVAKGRVPAVGESEAGAPDEVTDSDRGVGDDPLTYRRRWVSLDRHLTDVETEVDVIVEGLDPQLESALVNAAVLAGRYHDLGKAHAVFQDTLGRTMGDDNERAEADSEPRPWAKSGGTAPASHERRHFRHELASALALLAIATTTLDGRASWERDLVVYLVAAHHGRVRLGFRSLPDETAPPELNRPYALGVWHDEELPAVTVGDEVVPACRMDLEIMSLGRAADGTPSWAERAYGLLERLGPFRLAFLEALVRSADWRVSRRYDIEGGDDGR